MTDGCAGLAAPAAPRRVLHLFANYKWTGPADPAIRCAIWQRAAGHDVRFAQAGWTLPGGEHRMARELFRARLPVLAGLELRKHFQPLSVWRDARELRARLEAERFDVVHCHLLADHLIATLALRRMERRPRLVRSLYEPEPPPRRWRERLAFGATDGVVVPTGACAEAFASRFGFAAGRVLVQDPPVDPRRAAVGATLRPALELAADDFVIGITARIQPHRRFELLWEVARRVVEQRAQARFVLLGRGNDTDVRRLVREPVAALGLDAAVRLPGYLYEPDYSRALRALDAFVFLVPGSDGTCRAVREVQALGVPVVATRRGILPELLGESTALPGTGPSGLAVDEDPDALAAALVRLIDDRSLRDRLGAAGRARAAGPMDPRGAVRRLAAFYRALLDEPAGPGAA